MSPRRRLFATLLVPALVACGSSDEREPFDPATQQGGTDPGGSAGSPGSSGATNGDGGASGGASGATATKSDGKVGSGCAQKTDCDQALRLDCVTEIPAFPAAGFPGKTFPGGVCTRRCGEPNPDSLDPELQNLSPDCGPGAVCTQSTSSTGGGGRVDIQMCVKTCASDAECRNAEGYRCIAGAFGQKTCQAP